MVHVRREESRGPNLMQRRVDEDQQRRDPCRDRAAKHHLQISRIEMVQETGQFPAR